MIAKYYAPDLTNKNNSGISETGKRIGMDIGEGEGVGAGIGVSIRGNITRSRKD